MRNLIMLIIFIFGVFLYADGSELFPFGMNYSVCETWGDSLPEDEEFNQKYKISMDWTAAAGIKWWRAMMAFRWCDVQPKVDDEDYWNFDTEDSLVRWCGERGLHLLPSIGYTADFALNSATNPLGIEDRRLYPPDPVYWDEYQDYVKAIVERYDGDGKGVTIRGQYIEEPEWLKTPIKYWEFSNEPFNEGYFLGTPEQYVEMYEYTRVALKYADPEARILGPCMTIKNDSFKWKYFNPDSSKIVTDDFGYTSWGNAIRGIINSIDLEKIDVVSHHSYNHDYFMYWMDSLRAILKKYPGGGNKPIWITETGIQNSDVFKAERGIHEFCDTITSYVKYSCSSGVVFQDTVPAMWNPKKPLETIIDTFLNLEDTIVLRYRTDNYRKDAIIYNGGPLIYIYASDTIVALDIGDSLAILDQWAEEFKHTPDTQAVAYYELLTQIFDFPDFLNNLKVFFFCANNTINEGPRYPPIIMFGPKLGPGPGDTTYLPIKYSRQRMHSVWSVIDTLNDPYDAYYTIQNHILPDYTNLEDITVGIDTTKTYQAMNSITTNDFTIKSGGTVAMEAGDIIYLQDGFRVEKGGYFYGATNPRYGGGGMSSMKVAMPKAIKTPEENVSKGDSIPKVFSCAQNYPNPFTGSTTIKYGLPKKIKVKLDIYNLIGQKVRTLVNAQQSAGYKSVSWNGLASTGKEAPQGVYFYTFKAGDFTKHRKMILLK
jgi:hypothetical protein